MNQMIIMRAAEHSKYGAYVNETEYTKGDRYWLLSERGNTQVESMARKLEKEGLTPDIVITLIEEIETANKIVSAINKICTNRAQNVPFSRKERDHRTVPLAAPTFTPISLFIVQHSSEFKRTVDLYRYTNKGAIILVIADHCNVQALAGEGCNLPKASCAVFECPERGKLSYVKQLNALTV